MPPALPHYSRAGADEEGTHGTAIPAQLGQRGAVVAQLPPPALEVLLLEQQQLAAPVLLHRDAQHWHGYASPWLGTARGPGMSLHWVLLTAQVMGRKELILSTW